MKQCAGYKSVSGQKSPREEVIWVALHLKHPSEALAISCADRQEQTFVPVSTHLVSSRQDDAFHPLCLHQLRCSQITSCIPLDSLQAKGVASIIFVIQYQNEFENGFP